MLQIYKQNNQLKAMFMQNKMTEIGYGDQAKGKKGNLLVRFHFEAVQALFRGKKSTRWYRFSQKWDRN